MERERINNASVYRNEHEYLQCVCVYMSVCGCMREKRVFHNHMFKKLQVSEFQTSILF